MAYVYKHIRLDNNQVFYIGIGKSSNYDRAFSKKERNKYWYNIVNKCGYQVDIIKDGISIEEAIKEEINLIKEYGRKDLKKGTLVNLTDGGDGQVNMSEETKKKLAEFNLGRKIENHWSKTEEGKNRISEWTKGDKNPARNPEIAKKISDSKKGKKNPKIAEFAKQRTGGKNAFYGKTHSGEFREKMRQLKKGVALTEEHKQNLRVAMLNRPPYDYKDKQRECPHCGLIGGGGNMKRYHFENCKSLER
jgi:hypothetical protein